eukprot:7505978-Alexandrium_andersonii.AAC.1
MCLLEQPRSRPWPIPANRPNLRLRRPRAVALEDSTAQSAWRRSQCHVRHVDRTLVQAAAAAARLQAHR